MSEQEFIEGGLATLLGADQGAVSIVGVASLGAQRQTLFIEVFDGRIHTSAVAQIGQAIVGEGTPATTEAALVTAAGAAGVPVPAVLAATDDPTLVGGPVMVSERIDGLTIPRQILRAIDANVDADSGDRLANDCGLALAALHVVEVDALPDSVPRPGEDGAHLGYVDELETVMAELSEPMPVMRIGFNWLRRNAPNAATEPSVVHGDLRNGNIVVSDHRLAAVLDWELAHVGDPIEDLAWLCLRTWRFGNDDRPVGGFGSLDALRSGYEAALGVWDDERFRWWTVARTAWWGIGLARQAAAFRGGLTDSIVLAASGRRVVELEYDLLRLIEER
ncbi:MAG: phosphotransferase family protein [Acidobacteria bacterium]|nr:phosphotransferase family protein [Acidobacteriota bacterium]